MESEPGDWWPRDSVTPAWRGLRDIVTISSQHQRHATTWQSHKMAPLIYIPTPEGTWRALSWVLSVCWGLERRQPGPDTELRNLTPGVSIGVISQAVSGARWGQWGRQHDPGDAGPGARCQEMLSWRWGECQMSHTQARVTPRHQTQNTRESRDAGLTLEIRLWQYDMIHEWGNNEDCQVMGDKSCLLTSSHGIFCWWCCYLGPHVFEVVKS